MSNSYHNMELKFVSAEDLVVKLRAKAPGITIIDVRDEDYIGGHIKGCQNIPIDTLEDTMPELISTLKDQDTIIFHCGLSQQRGPKAALTYLRERKAIVDGGKLVARKAGKTLEDAQEVLVLKGGFYEWQMIHGDDKELTENYNKKHWREIE